MELAARVGISGKDLLPLRGEEGGGGGLRTRRRRRRRRRRRQQPKCSVLGGEKDPAACAGAQRTRRELIGILPVTGVERRRKRDCIPRELSI